MRSLQDYVNIYRSIANSANLQGDSVELLVQMLAQASYISEVENVSYVQEASLEKAKLMNSKIQRCIDEMYSVYRGSCPRVILNIRPKKYLTFNLFDEIISSNNFKVYYLGVYDNGNTSLSKGTEQVALLDGFNYGTVTLSPSPKEIDSEDPLSGTYQILGLIASDFSDIAWKTTKTRDYYFENVDENLSNDMWVSIDGEYYDITRRFSDHILNSQIFDLTLPSFGSRLYVANVFQDGGAPENLVINARYFKYCELSDFPKAELKKINIKGTDLVPFKGVYGTGQVYDLLTVFGAEEYEGVSGLVLIDSKNRDSVVTTHYRAARDRYVNSLLRSNSDIGTLLEEMYPKKIALGGTSYDFQSSGEGTNLNVYYAPINTTNLLTEDEIEAYQKKTMFFVQDTVFVEKGINYNAVINVDLELFQAASVDSQINEILDNYSNKFRMNLEERTEEIKSLISKISNVKTIKSFTITYVDETGKERSFDDIAYGKDENGSSVSKLYKTYFTISSVINSTIQTAS